jgi:hypothetical protein
MLLSIHHPYLVANTSPLPDSQYISNVLACLLCFYGLSPGSSRDSITYTSHTENGGAPGSIYLGQAIAGLTKVYRCTAVSHDLFMVLHDDITKSTPP